MSALHLCDLRNLILTFASLTSIETTSSHLIFVTGEPKIKEKWEVLFLSLSLSHPTPYPINYILPEHAPFQEGVDQSIYNPLTGSIRSVYKSEVGCQGKCGGDRVSSCGIGRWSLTGTKSNATLAQEFPARAKILVDAGKRVP